MAYERLSKNTTNRLQKFGLAGLVASGDRPSIRTVTKQLRDTQPSPENDMVVSSLAGLRASDPEVVRAIGQFAVSYGNPAVVQSLTYALYAVHTKDALSFLYKLLSNGDKLVKEWAVMGFSAFVTGMRIGEDGLDMSEALDEVMNPGKRATTPPSRYDTEETRQYVHFGPFPRADAADKYVTFWKRWFERNQQVL